MLRRRFLHLLISLLLIINLATPLAASPQAQQAQAPAPSSASPDMAARLAAIESFAEARRRELGIPGMALVIVKNDQVIFMKGFGLRDVEHNLPVTPDTLFAIGSATKAFTAMTAMMTVDDGRMSLDDSPKKFLPYFKLRDPEADAKITIRDLLTHRSGLQRTDLAMVTNQLNREELIRVAGLAKPTARLGERFQYQNIMYTAAGEVVARAQNMTWEQMVMERIFKPLGMKSSNLTVAETERAADHSLGYDHNSEINQTRRVPMRPIPASAPAGAINSNARDMAEWLRFLLAGGMVNGRRLISERSFNELWTKQIAGALGEDYGLGWFLGQWRGHKIVHHGGNIDGFNAEVAMMPDQKLGFVMLTNVSTSTLSSSLMENVWNNLAGDGPGGVAVDPQSEAGSYKQAQAGFSIEVAFRNGHLEMTVPNQPVYPLESLGGRKYRLSEPAPPGFYVTFRAAQNGDTEMVLEQPTSTFMLTKVKATNAAQAPAEQAQISDLLREVIGSYEFEQSPDAILEIREQGNEVVAIAPMQPPYPLRDSAHDLLAFKNLPASYTITVKRDEHGKITGLTVKQPEGEFNFRRAQNAAAAITVEELMTKAIAAIGGEASLRKHSSSVTTFDIDYENQGVTGEGVTSARAPGSYATEITLMALGKKIGRIFEYFDGTGGGSQATFIPARDYAGRQLAN
ncbi:MAG TPA: serine hydrolase domain-containing protein, partial [Pyrinomonadaceae bacterium]|nr:serine hydrolase domain-containing protein [Pyrinomonadaceae bacterium]